MASAELHVPAALGFMSHRALVSLSGLGAVCRSVRMVKVLFASFFVRA